MRFFRPPNEHDLQALKEAEARLQERWPEWEAEGLIPTERFPEGNDMRPVQYGMPRWCDLFTPRQLLGHLTLIEGLNRLKADILEALGPERGRAVVTYLQFAIDKGLDYNSRQTRWEYTRGIVKGTFGRHDFSVKWTFGEMIFTGPNSGAAWGLSQVMDAYRGIATLVEPIHHRIRRSGFSRDAPGFSRDSDDPSVAEEVAMQEVATKVAPTSVPPVAILNGTAAHMPSIPDGSIDLVCMDPPYYDNVQYGELSDYFYVWQKRTLGDLYPGVFTRRLVNKTDEAVANPVRDGSRVAAKATYERMMLEIFAECRRTLTDDGLMTLMFTHKSQDAWEALTRSLIEAGWTITASFPVESEGQHSIHQKDTASAVSSIFLACRKRTTEQPFPAVWTGLGGQGVQHRIRTAVQQSLVEFKSLNLMPVDEMVACYGRALHVLSEQWPVMDGDEPVSPLRAMNEASRVVAENQIARITYDHLSVDDLDPETAMALTLYGIWGLYEFAFDEALNLSRSLNITLSTRPAGYHVEGRMIGINQEAGRRQGRSRGAEAEETGYHAPLVRKGSKLRLARPEEKHPHRLERPQTDWDVLHGMLQACRRGDTPVARAYLEQHAPQHTRRILDLLDVWAAEMDDPDLRHEAEAAREIAAEAAPTPQRSSKMGIEYHTTLPTKPGHRALRKGRVSLAGHYYVVTTGTYKRQPFFRQWQIGRLVVLEMRRLQEENIVQSLAWVIMPDHLHWLLVLGESMRLSGMMQTFKGRTARRVNQALQRTGKVWQTAFYEHALRRDEDVRAVARYIVTNPLRAGLVTQLRDYPLWDAVWVGEDLFGL